MLFKFIIFNIFNIVNALVYDKCINSNHITLTFDDGPTDNTLNLLKILNKHNIKGTFFINGLNVIKNNYQQLVQTMYNQNHTIGTHGFSHADMEKLNNFNAMRELYDNELIFRQLLNKRPYFYRPPYFSYDANVVNMCSMFGYEIIASNLNTNDWNSTTSDEIYNNFINGLNDTLSSDKNGKIVIQHDYQTLNIDALEKIINYALEKKYTFVPLKTCLGLTKDYNKDNTYGPFLLNGI